VTRESHGIAVIGMAGRFPGGNSVEQLWQNLVHGVESVAQLDVERWAEVVGAHAALLDRPDIVKMKPRVDGEFLFDADFFGYTPREAQVLDPQQRLFLECAWEALEDAGTDSERFPGAIGVCAGISQSSYLMNYLQWDRNLGEAVGGFNIGLSNMNDSLATRTAYKLNLRGSAYAVQCFCSTSLVAIHLGCQSLAHHETDMMLAGGVTLYLPQEVGYQYREGGILSPDGHTRTFDAKARGMVFGSGLAVVVLKRLADALRDGDTIHAVILGSAVNNDGSLKVGFSAPSVTGQAEVIAEALTAAGVNPETIGYVEAHGTATALGDPAEVAGLTKAWRRWTDEKGYCAIGSVKTNIGHLDAAAGVTGLIKATLALERGLIPPSLHFEDPNPAIDFASSPFYVNTRLTDWKRGDTPRRAAVSSFGIGGTNAHAVLEEAPAGEPSSPARPWQLLVLSAKTDTALEEAAARLKRHLESSPETNLADVAFTLQLGRRVFNHRRAVVARDVADAVVALPDPRRAESLLQERQGGPVAFMFTGQGSQYVNMGLGLYRAEPVFQAAVDSCVEVLRGPVGFDLREVLYPRQGEEERASRRLTETGLTQPALFVVEYALARLWTSWGVEPAAMIGHSVGEYVAAHLAGVFTLEDALGLVAERGRLMQDMPRGAMLAVPLSEEELRPYLRGGVDLASVNTPTASVLSGPTEEIERAEVELEARGVMSRRLHTSHAFHSSMMDPILGPFRARVERTERRPPTLPFLSNVTGDWIRAEEATDPGYWSRHLRGCVRFAEGVKRLLAEKAGVTLVEVGPGNTLSALARQQVPVGGATAVIASLRHPKEAEDDRAFVLRALGRVWLAGTRVDWVALHAGGRRRRVPLPTYPFERKEYRVLPQESVRRGLAIARGSSGRRPEFTEWFYQPSWRRVTPSAALAEPPPGGARWLVFADEQGLGDALLAELRARGQAVAVVRAGDRFGGDSRQGLTIQPGARDDYTSLLRTLAADGSPTHIAHLWGVTGGAPPAGPDGLAEAQERGFFSMLFLAQALEAGKAGKVRVGVVTDHMQDVIGGELTQPEKATVLGPCRTIPQELKNFACVAIDVALPASAEMRALAVRLIRELSVEPQDRVVAYRGPHRWVEWIEPMPLGPANGASPVRERGVYLITGGLGGIGLVLAEHLAQAYKARLVLTARSPLPPREDWERWLAGHGPQDATSLRIRQVQRLQELGGEVLVAAADVASRPEMEAVVARAVERFGPIQGAIHSAGVAGGGVIQLKQRDVAAGVLSPKVQGTFVLEAVLRDQPLDFLLLCSSTTSWLGGVGQVDYCGANAFLDAFAHSRRSSGTRRVISVNWYAWREVGMAVKTAVTGALKASRELSLKVGIGSGEGVEAFHRVLAAGLPQVAVLSVDIMPRLLNRFVSAAPATEEDTSGGDGRAEAVAASEPRAGEPLGGSDLERAIVETWRKVLGRERIGVNDNFFELGGDSLTALQAVALLRAVSGRDIPIATFYGAPTVALLAKALGTEPNAEEAPVTLGEVEQRAGTRLEMMERRRRARMGTPAGSGGRG
jgi:acyl transferase domain-containing protein